MQTVSGDIEQPTYQVIRTNDNIQIRFYDPMIIAQVTVQGPRDQAISRGFRLLADFIFGNNTQSTDIAMTAPVQQQQQQGQKIAMTAPVQQSKQGNEWQVSFVMPKAYNMASIPKPVDNRVELITVAEQYYAVIEFSGRSSADNLARHQTLLDTYMQEHNLIAKGEVKYAFYNPPWTPPFVRRNEIMYPISVIN
ncbi:heme-binding protein [Catenovulum sp. SM1970]|uniref:heme-binding protein n=1 Tax=Marinifaba aquimaris TaxID=2741323 RepID=UPI001573AB2D|nr:heme-binding protein [Marinifaba aquimaris]